MRKKKWTLKDVQSSLRACTSLFHALGDPARQDILLLLAQHDRLNVLQITEQMTLSRPTVSHHLRVLKDAGLVDAVKESRENHYFLVWDASIDRLGQLLEQAQEACA